MPLGLASSVDLTSIDGIDVTTPLAAVSEVGADMSRFPTVAHSVCAQVPRSLAAR